jgi:hypothetical protein
MLFAIDTGGVPSIARMVTVRGNSAPTAALTQPPNGATFTAPATVDLAAGASDADGTVAKVEFFSGSTRLGEDTSAPYTFAWTGVGAGGYTLTARATDDLGATTTSASATITVTAVNAAPTTSITFPADGATFAWKPSITITAAAADSDGTIQKVEFFRDDGAVKLGEDTSAPYSWRWKNVPSGSHALRVRATDNRGAVTTSGSVHITVRTRN